MVEAKKQWWKEFLFSKTLVNKSKAHKLAYISVMTALCVVANMYEIPAGITQFSLTLVVTALAGVLIGPIFGFSAGFLGDVVGFLYHPKGEYLITLSLAAGLFALLAGVIMNGINSKGKSWLFYGKIAAVCILTFLVCTVGITTTTFWVLYAKVDYWTYLISRLFAQFQILNSLFNYVLLFIAIPTLIRIKPLKIKVD